MTWQTKWLCVCSAVLRSETDEPPAYCPCCDSTDLTLLSDEPLLQRAWDRKLEELHGKGN